MEDFLQTKNPSNVQKQTRRPVGYVRLFFLITAVLLLGQVLSFLQLQISRYHQELTNDFKVVLTVISPLKEAGLRTLEEKLRAEHGVQQVRLFSSQDGLKMLQRKNPRLTQAVVALGREVMPVYFELRLQPGAINNIRPFMQHLSAQYPQLSAKYVPQQADMILYGGLCLRILYISAALALALLLVFMFLVEAHPIYVSFNAAASAAAGIGAALLALGLFAAAVYPTGLLTDSLHEFTTWGRQALGLCLGGLLGWTLGKWQRF